MAQTYGCRRNGLVTTHHLKLTQLISAANDLNFIGCDCLKIFIVDELLLVRDEEEALIDLFKRIVGIKRVAEDLKAMLERMASRPWRENDLALGDSDIRWVDDFVGGTLFEDAILVDTTRMCECICTHNCLVRLNKDACTVGDKAAGFEYFGRLDVGVCATKLRPADLKRHHDLFKTGVSRPLTDAIDGALNLSGTCADSSKRICGRKAKIVVTVR